MLISKTPRGSHENTQASIPCAFLFSSPFSSRPSQLSSRLVQPQRAVTRLSPTRRGATGTQNPDRGTITGPLLIRNQLISYSVLLVREANLARSTLTSSTTRNPLRLSLPPAFAARSLSKPLSRRHATQARAALFTCAQSHFLSFLFTSLYLSTFIKPLFIEQHTRPLLRILRYSRAPWPFKMLCCPNSRR